jgi:hypothetical protein
MTAEQIVRVLAAKDAPLCRGDCVMCSTGVPAPVHLTTWDPEAHDVGCPWRLAVAWVQQADG